MKNVSYALAIVYSIIGFDLASCSTLEKKEDFREDTEHKTQHRSNSDPISHERARETKEDPEARERTQAQQPQTSDLIIIPLELQHIQHYFLTLGSENPTEGSQYNKLLRSYRLARQTFGYNPSAIIILSEDRAAIFGNVTQKDGGSRYHTEPNIIKNLLMTLGVKPNLEGLKLGLYTLNSPCILRSTNTHDDSLPCMSLIEQVVSKPNLSPLFLEKPAHSMLVRYDLIYDDKRWKDTKHAKSKYAQSNIDSLKKVLPSLKRNLERRIETINTVMRDFAKDPLLTKDNQENILKYLANFKTRLGNDLRTCGMIFAQIPEPRAHNQKMLYSFSSLSNISGLGYAFNIAYGLGGKIPLIFTPDWEKFRKDTNPSISQLFSPTEEGTLLPLPSTEHVKRVLFEEDRMF